MVRMPDKPAPPRHPANVAFDQFIAGRTFVDVYERNRLEAAFMAGWNAAERRVVGALTDPK